jgi:predicted N-acyltransferase
MRNLGQWTKPKDLAKVASKNFEIWYNHVYLDEVDTGKRKALRKARPEMNAEGVRLGIWSESSLVEREVGGLHHIQWK